MHEAHRRKLNLLRDALEARPSKNGARMSEWQTIDDPHFETLMSTNGKAEMIRPHRGRHAEAARVPPVVEQPAPRRVLTPEEQATERQMDVWKKHLNEDYDALEKGKFLKPLLNQWDEQGKLGHIIADIGSSGWSILWHLDRERFDRKKKINVDWAFNSTSKSTNGVNIRFNAKKIHDTQSMEYKRALLAVSHALELDPHTEADPGKADTIIFSELLNYVDFRRVLSGFAPYLRPGGRLLIVNNPKRGFKDFINDDGVQKNSELVSFLEETGFEIEEQHFPWGGEKDLEHAFTVILARKQT